MYLYVCVCMYVSGNPFVVDAERLFSFVYNGGVAYALRIWPQGGRKKKAGNVMVYLNDRVVDVNGNWKARTALRSWFRDWAF